jgi:hypothetical protein
MPHEHISLVQTRNGRQVKVRRSIIIMIDHIKLAKLLLKIFLRIISILKVDGMNNSEMKEEVCKVKR